MSKSSLGASGADQHPRRPATAKERRRLKIIREATTKASSRLTVRGHEKDRAPPPVTLPRISCLEKDFDA